MQYQFQDYKCILCKQYFNPPLLIPYLLPCSHSVCNQCLQTSNNYKSTSIICPEDLQSNLISSTKIHTTAKKALERLIKEHKNFNQNNQFLCIQSLSKNLQCILLQQEEQKHEFLQLIHKIFKSQMKRLDKLEQKIKEELYSPVKIVQEWKSGLKIYLESLKGIDRKNKSQTIQQELNYYIEQGRKIKQQLCFYNDIDFEQLANAVIVAPQHCLQSSFSIKGLINAHQQMTDKDKSDTREQKSLQFSWTDQESLKLKRQDKSLKNSQNKSMVQSKLNEQKNISKVFKQNSKQKYNDKYNKKSMLEIRSKNVKTQAEHFIYNDNLLQTNFSTKSQMNPNNQLRKFIQLNKNNNYHDEKRSSYLKEEDKCLKELILSQNIKEPLCQYDTCKTYKYQLPFCTNQHQNYQENISRDEEDDILLTNEHQECKKWQLGSFNFLQQWQIQRNLSVQSLKIKKRQPFNWQQQKNNYIRKMQLINVEQAYQKTQITDRHTIELINHNLEEINFRLYLSKFQWNHLEVIKFVKDNLNDSQLNELLNYMAHAHVTTVVLCGNSLTQLSLDALLNFIKVNKELKNIYLSKNNLNYLKGQTRTKIQNLRENGLNLYI